MPAYRYLLCDLLTDQVVAQLPLTDVSFDRYISRTGSLQASLPVVNRQLVPLAQAVRAYCGRNALWVFRDNAIWWGGIIWTAPVAQGERGPVGLQLTAATFDDYANRRQLYADIDFDETDAGVIIPSLWRTIQGDGRGNIGVIAPDQPIGTLLDRSYSADAEYVGTSIQEVGDLVDGPEHTVDTYLDQSGTRVKQLRLARTLGSPDPRTVFQRAVATGGRLLEWTDTVDAVNGGTTFQLRGNGFVSDRLYADALLAQGWPLLDATDDRSDVDDDVELAQLTATLRDQRAGALRTRGYTVQVGDTGWNPNRLGDVVRIKLADLWHDEALDPGSTDLAVRPVGVKVTPSARGVTEQVELLFGDS